MVTHLFLKALLAAILLANGCPGNQHGSTDLWLICSSIGDGKTFPCGPEAVQADGEACNDKFCQNGRRTMRKHIKRCLQSKPAGCSTSHDCQK